MAKDKKNISIVALTAEDLSYTVLADTVVSHYYLDLAALPYCTKKRSAYSSAATVANGGGARPRVQVSVPLVPSLSYFAQYAYVFDDLKTGSLISVGQLCDNECIAIISRFKL